MRPASRQHPDKVYKRPDGIVIIDPAKAKGAKEILDSCPYNAIFWNEETGAAPEVHLVRPPARPGLEGARGASRCAPTRH